MAVLSGVRDAAGPQVVHAVEGDAVIKVAKITRHEEKSPAQIARRFCSTSNAREWMGRPPGSFLFQRLTAKATKGGGFDVEYIFVPVPDSILGLEAESGSRIYMRQDFNELELPVIDWDAEL